MTKVPRKPWWLVSLALAILAAALALKGWSTSSNGVSESFQDGRRSSGMAGSAGDVSGEGPAPGTPLALANELLSKGDFGGALSAYEELVARGHEAEDEVLLADSLNGLGLVYKSLGDYHQAITLYSEALETCRASGGRLCQAEILHNLGTCYTLLGELPAARDALEEALELWPADSFDRSSTLTAIATLDDLEGQPDQAIELFREALRVRRFSRRVDPERRRKGLGATLDRLATAYKHAGRPEDARRVYGKALEIWSRGGYRAQFALTSDNLGWLSVEDGEPEVALDYFSRALPLLEEARASHDQAHTLLGMAQAYRQLGDLSTTMTLLHRATEIIESLRSTSYSHLLRAAFLARRQPFYELSVEVLMQQHEADPGGKFDYRALEAAERFRARGLLDQLQVERTALRGAATGPFLEMEEQLHRQMAARDRQRLDLVRRSSPAQEIAEIERELRALAMRYDQLRAQLWAALPRSPVAPSLTSSEMMALLDDDTLLLVYSLGEERSFLWRVSSHEVMAYELPNRSRIEAAAWQAYSFLRNSDQRGGGSKGREALERLSGLLLGPVEETLGQKRLLIMADGLIHYIPFAALAPSHDRPLLADHEIVSLPSASVVKTLRDRAAARPPAPKVLAVMADPVFGHEDLRFGSAAIAKSVAEEPRSYQLDRLERSGQEAEAILALVPPEDRFGALGFDATREAVIEGKLAGFRFVHIATHGELNDEQPEYTHLVLSLVDRQGRSLAGRLYQHEIGNLELAADLVVLSACNSALGKHVRGEGLVGMTRGFMDAGASRVMVSLWYVSEEATALLMERFYIGLLVEGKTPAAALQAAQLWLQSIPQWQPPFYWAGFVLQGEWR